MGVGAGLVAGDAGVVIVVDIVVEVVVVVDGDVVVEDDTVVVDDVVEEGGVEVNVVAHSCGCGQLK